MQCTDVIRIVLFVAVVAAILSLAALPLLGGDFAYQPVSSTGASELRGIFDHQLRLGALAGLALGLIGIAALNGEIPQIRVRSSIVCVACVVLLLLVLILSRARLYVADAAIALLLTALLSRKGLRKVFSLLLISVVSIIAASNLGTILDKLTDMGFDATLTGRTAIWSRAMNGITDDTRLLGHGFGTFKLPEFDYLYPINYRASHAHSSYLQALFETGVLGLLVLCVLIIVQLVVAWRYSVRCNKFSYSMFLVLYAALGSTTGLVYADARLTPIFGLMMLFLAIESRSSINLPGISRSDKTTRTSQLTMVPGVWKPRGHRSQ
jgi:O-antigen ligase